MQTTAEYYSKKTIADLRAMLLVAGIKTSSRTKKADLVTYVVNMLDQDHEIANAMNAVDKAMKAIVSYQGIGTSLRVASYHAQNGTHKLTARQRRRVAKKFNRELSYA